MMTSVKEVNRLFRDAKRSFNKAIELAKRSMIVGEVNFPSEKKQKVRKTKDLPDKDKDGYMNKRPAVTEE